MVGSVALFIIVAAVAGVIVMGNNIRDSQQFLTCAVTLNDPIHRKMPKYMTYLTAEKFQRGVKPTLIFKEVIMQDNQALLQLKEAAEHCNFSFEVRK